MPVPRHGVALACAAGGCLALCGCALFTSGVSALSYWSANENGKENPLPPIRPARDALQIDVTFVERPLGDRLLGHELWSEIDETLNTADHEAVSNLGLKVGNAGSTLCQPLERMLHPPDALDAESAKRGMILPLQTFCVRTADEAPIETNALPKCTIDLPLPSGRKTKTYQYFKSVLKMTTYRLQDGWARLEFVPEIHYGSNRLRALPTEEGGRNKWSQAESQQVDTLWAQRFSAKLHVGEMIVITASPDDPHTFGFSSFIRDDPKKGPVQRLLVVRLSNMARIDPVYAPAHSGKSNLPEKGLSAGK